VPRVGSLITRNTNDGVTLVAGADANFVQGYLIGTDITIASALGNGAEGYSSRTRGTTSAAGHRRRATSSADTIGGTAAEARNVIAGNLAECVAISGLVSVGKAILGNSLFENGMLGIDLNASDGITPTIRA